MRRATVAVLACVIAAAGLRAAAADPPPGAGAGVVEVQDPFEGTEVFEDSEEASFHLLRVVDLASGQGIPKARVMAVEEALHSLTRLPDPVATVETDEWGWARVPTAFVSGWTLIDAEGYGPRGWMWDGSLEVVELARGADAPVEVRDPLDRPVAGALVGYRLGCGHTPDLRHATTDASGVAVLSSVDPLQDGWLWPLARGLRADDVDFGDEWRPGLAPLVLRCAWGATVEGRVLDAQGRPVAGAFVGGGHYHRGPWTRTDERGDFVLLGAPSAWENAWLTVHLRDEEYERTPGFRFLPPPEGVPVTIRLPEEGAAPEPLLPVEVVLVDAADRSPVPAALLAWRTSDGLATLAADGEPREAFRLELPAGLHELRTSGGLATHASGRARVEVPGTPRVEIALRRHPRRAVEAEDLPGGVEIVLASASRERVLTAVTEADSAGPWDIPVPLDEDLVVRVAAGWRTRVFPVPRGSGGPGAEPLVLRWWKPTEIRLRVVGPDGRPARALVFVESALGYAAPGDALAADPDATIALDPDAEGWATVVVEPETPGLAGRRLRVVLPPDGGVVDLGEVHCPLAREQRVELDPPPPVRLGDLQVRWHAGGEVRWDGDGNGPWSVSTGSQAVPEGAVLETMGPGMGPYAMGLLPRRFALDGTGPWTLRWPRGAAVVHLKDEEGVPVDGAMLFDGHLLRFDAGRAAVVGLDPGEHVVVAGAPGRVAVRATVTVSPDAEARLDLRLRMRPHAGK